MAQSISHMYRNYPLTKHYILLENVLARCVYQSIQDGRILCENIRYCTAIFGNSKIYIRVFILVCVYVDKQCNSYLLLVAVYSKQTRFRKCNIVFLFKGVDRIYLSVVLMFFDVVWFDNFGTLIQGICLFPKTNWWYKLVRYGSNQFVV